VAEQLTRESATGPMSGHRVALEYQSPRCWKLKYWLRHSDNSYKRSYAEAAISRKALRAPKI
jgi:hypothetical protein